MSSSEKSLDELLRTSENIWAELESFLASLTYTQMTELHDGQGWNVKDHLSHLAAWEQALLLLFDGTPRYQTLGIDLAKADNDLMDEINAQIRQRWQSKSVLSVISEYRNIHNLLMAKVKGLSDADLSQPVAKYFPQEVPAYQGKVFDIIQNNLVNHVVEHLAWIKTLITDTTNIGPVEQPVVIVTGASKGLGAAIADIAADHGACVVLTARSEPELVMQVQRIKERGGNALSIVGDISRFEDCQKIIENTVQTFGRIDALINNAGTIEPLAPISESRHDDWSFHIAVNLLGPMMMCQLANPYLRQTKGKVINITSHAAENSIPGASAYSSSKAALNRFSKTLAVEEPEITIILFVPGETDTPMQAVIREKGDGKTTNEIYRFFVDLHEQGKLLPPRTPALSAVSLALKAPLQLSGEILQWDDERVVVV
jgi:NAD(P)-dependent dehydrogenase (short-subunit alcohol dehydrogenase family)